MYAFLWSVHVCMCVAVGIFKKAKQNERDVNDKVGWLDEISTRNGQSARVSISIRQENKQK